MKKRNLKSLMLNKEIVSDLKLNSSIKGGIVRSGNAYCKTMAFKCSLVYCFTANITCPIHNTTPME